ncbi:MAG: hypothetical protein ACLGI9_07145 [Thermoanaerobaculia bacterium]
MSEDRILRELGRLAREEREAEEARLDERWDRLAAGTLTAEEEAELRALAETSPEAREAYEAFRPLGAGFQARVVDAAAAELRDPAGPQEPRSRVLPFRRPAARLTGWLVAAGTVAAALLLFLRTPASPSLDTLYAVAELSGGARAFRGGEAEPSKVFVPGSLLTLVLSPNPPVSGPVEARGFLARGRKIVPLEPKPSFEVVQGGAVRLRGTLGKEIRLPPGEQRLWIVVGRPGKIPSVRELEAELREQRTRHEHWQALYADLRVEERPPP